jgi:hypothetical protein
MPVTAMRWLLLTCAALVLAGAVAENAKAYTLTDWMRSWPTQWAAPQPVSPVVAWPAAPAPPSVVLPPAAAVQPPPIAAAPPVAVAPPPTYTPPPIFTPPPAMVTPPVAAAPPASCGVGVVGCDTRAPTAVPMTTTAPVQAPVAQGPCRCCHTSCFGALCRLFHHPRRHQTAWARVPTTTFRPVLVVDPVTGASSTSMQPCTTYTWQVQRVPFFGLGSPRPFFLDGTAAPPGYMVSPAPGFIDSATSAPAATSTPYYIPQTLPPAASPFAPPLPAGTSAPGASGWQRSNGAEERPTLTPGEAQGLQRVPATGPYPRIPLSDPVDTRWPANVNPPSSAPVQPVPDPDAPPETEAAPIAPALYGPSERTAIHPLRPASLLTPIVWPDQSATSDVPNPSTDAQDTLRLEAPRIDNGQWRVVEP